MDGPTFAERLKRARQTAGLSQVALAQQAGLTAPYVSLLEGGRRRPPSAPVIERLAKALGVPADPLLEQAALERSPAPIRRRIEGLDRERGKVHRARDRILSTTLFRLARHAALFGAFAEGPEVDSSGLGAVLGRVAPQLRGVRSAQEARAKSAEILAQVGPAERERLLESLPDLLPTGAEQDAAAAPAVGPSAVAVGVRDGLAPDAAPTESVVLDARWCSPRAFLWRIRGDEGYPRLEAGDLLLVDPERTPATGDLIALRIGARDLARVLRRRGDEVRLEALRPEVAPLRLTVSDFHPVGTVVRVIRPLA